MPQLRHQRARKILIATLPSISPPPPRAFVQLVQYPPALVFAPSDRRWMTASLGLVASGTLASAAATASNCFRWRQRTLDTTTSPSRWRGIVLPPTRCGCSNLRGSKNSTLFHQLRKISAKRNQIITNLKLPTSTFDFASQGYQLRCCRLST